MSTQTADTLTARGNNRSRTPKSSEFRQFISSNWADAPTPTPDTAEVAAFAAARRAELGSQFTGFTLIIGAGAPRVRSNDTDYRFRAHSAFSHLTGWGAQTVPGAVLVLSPHGQDHSAALYFRAPAGRDTDEFYANSAIGEFWTGPRPGLAEVGAALDLPTHDISELAAALRPVQGTPVAAITADDPALAELVEEIRPHSFQNEDPDTRLAEAASELRLIKDAYEIAQLQEAVRISIEGFARVVQELPRAKAHRRGERIVEGAFFAHAREEGNDLGYDTIAAAGKHACTLHWTDNPGSVRDGDLLLLDAGVEIESLYTADVTRTLPISGTFTPAQRRVYEAVLEAADAAFKVAVPGNRFRDVHNAAMAIIARKVSEWGLLPIPLEETLRPELQFHRRYMVHGTSHHLGLDVHDCAQARRELYLDGVITPGMVFTIEPGLYLQPDDLTVPAELRGIGVRIEDDVLITDTGNVNLTAALPRDPDGVEAWMRTVSIS